jgi:plastocyanin
VVAAAALAGPVSAGQAPMPKPAIVTVNDFYFGPDAVTIKPGRTVKWIWSEANIYPHDVHLKQGPMRLQERSTYSTRTSAVSGATFKKTFERTGTYHFICTIHPTLMKLTITVKK